MHRLTLALAALTLAFATAGTGAALEGPRQSGLDSYRRYCASCHGLDARGTPATPGIDLTRLGARYGRPLAGPPMLDRLGARPPLHAQWLADSRVCGERFLQNLSPGTGTRLFRQGTAIEILRYLDTVQIEKTAAR